MLAKLLKSKNPEDLQAANRLIKNMVKQVCVAESFSWHRGYWFKCLVQY